MTSHPRSQPDTAYNPAWLLIGWPGLPLLIFLSVTVLDYFGVRP